jgi:hypothetical protein
MIDATRFFANPAAGMTTKTRNRIVVLFILAFPFVLFLGFLISEFAKPLPPIPPLPNPNGYDDLVKAGEMVSTNSWNYDSTNLAQLRDTTAANAEALALARAGLSNECRVPLQFSKAYAANHIHELIAFRSLAQAFVAEGKLAEKENRFGDAAKSYLDVIHFGNEAGRGGVIMDEMIGIAVESLGVQQLQKTAGDLNANSCRDTIQTLEALAAHRQSWADVLQQEDNWARRTYSGLQGQMLILYYHLIYFHAREQNYQRCVDAINSTQKQEGQLLINLAARAYELDKGKPPESLADLVPDYLKAVPQDPFTGTNMIYSPR